MNGLGFLIWKLSNMPAVDVLIPILQAVECKWISIKVADGIYKYNVKDGNDKPLMAFIQALQDAGIEVGGWHYVYALSSPGAQGDRIMERREKLGLKHVLANIEDPRFRDLTGPEANTWAKTYMNKQHAGTEYGHCSHRFPTWHPYIPHQKMLAHERMDDITPMVYWELAHNPAEQMQRSLDEYRAISDKPFIPIGSTYARGEPGKPGYWEPSVDDLVEFVDASFTLDCPAYGFYSLDWIIVHERADWLNAISMGGGVEPPPPPVEPEEFVVVNCAWLNGRSEPKVVDDNRVVSVRAGQKVTNLNQPSGDWEKCGLGPITCYMHGDYLEPAP